MDLMSAVARMAARRPHVLVVEVPGWALTRISAERELRRRGWVRADAPADSDILLTCGLPGPEFGEVLDRVWDQLPGPRVRVDAMDPDQVLAVLDRSVQALLDGATQRDDADARTAAAAGPSSDHDHDHDHGSDQETEETEPESAADGDGDTSHEDGDQGDTAHEDTDHGGMDHGEDDQANMNHGGMDHKGMSHGDGDQADMDHAGMDHGDMDMPMPGGIGLAEGGTDRDGLDLDVLHVSLGPVLPHWPAGLVVRCSLQGDVVTDASVELLRAADPGVEQLHGDAGMMRSSPGFTSARTCDQAAGLLSLLGFERMAARAERLRDAVLDGTPPDQVAADVAHLGRHIRRSRVLRWSLEDLPGARERLLAMLGAAETNLGSAADAVTAVRYSPTAGTAGVEQIPGLITGLDVTAARLVVASLGLDTAPVALAGSDRD
ncbi:hypothetical protein E8P82_08220 [Arthrobacter echini]|uniref:Uncharacterized protein n=1 Tax=Arthrobacter echini TaxID=1529066 RepID=A0A4S5E4V0_9MICC|nr:hypothetical protein [Arthrobacter echini]THJ66443.1 hypothetical protein E8P82_08220 [Arthrobacter echini]